MSKYYAGSETDSSQHANHKNFWLSWPGAILGSIGITLVIVFFVFQNSILVGQQPEFQEIKTQLLRGDLLKNYFEMVSDVEATLPAGKGSRLSDQLTGKKPRPRWQVRRNGSKSSGHFTVDVRGWQKLSDKNRVGHQVEVSFEKDGDQPLVITKIEGISIHYPPRDAP